MDISLMASLPGMWARGAEICTLNLLTGLKERGYKELYFHATLTKDLPEDMSLYLNDKFMEVSLVGHTWDRDVDGNDRMLRDRLYGAEPDILLYAFDKTVPGLAPDVKSVLVVHGISQNDFAGYHPEHTDAVVCVSQYAADMAPTYGIPLEKIHHIPNGVPQTIPTIDSPGMWRDIYHIPKDAWVWCFVGGLTRLKRPQLLIAALARRQRDDEHIIFAGLADGGMLLWEYAEALGVLERCHFLGHVDHIGDVYNASDCLVITSERESMPLTILEAMSAGLGIVANPVGGIPEVLEDKVFAELVDVALEGEFDAALDTQRLTAPPPAKYWFPSDPVIAWQQNYSLEIMADNYDKLFGKLLGGK